MEGKMFAPNDACLDVGRDNVSKGRVCVKHVEPNAPAQVRQHKCEVKDGASSKSSTIAAQAQKQ